MSVSFSSFLLKPNNKLSQAESPLAKHLVKNKQNQQGTPHQ